MRFQTLGDKREFVSLHVRAAEAISAGAPVCLSLNGTQDGFLVSNLSTAGADHAHSLFMGVAKDAIAANQIGETIIFGLCQQAILARTRTRAASTDPFVSQASIAALAVLKLDTVNNAFETAAASQAASGFLPVAILGESQASLASLASGTASTYTSYAVTSLVKVFLRAM